MTKTIATSNTNSASIPTEKMGPAGVFTHLHVVPIFKNDTKSDEERLRDTTPRKFRISARLAKGIETASNIDINFDFQKTSGDSLFVVPKNVSYMKIETLEGIFFFHPNEKKCLSTVQFECTSKSSFEARQLFHRIVGPSLDHLAYIGNSPLHVVQVTVIDEVHNISSTEILSPYPLVTLNPGIGKVPGVLAPVYAMYREAKNAASPFYKFFCLYKILEGLLKTLRGKLYQEAKAKGILLPPLEAKVPYYSDISASQKPYIGKSITRFFEEFLTTHFRNSMAHFISDEGAVLNVNEMDGIERYSAVVHITDLCCREVISHFEKCIDVLESHPA